MEDIQDVADYIIVALDKAGEEVAVHKLHKLLYYVQAWHLALNEEPLFQSKFQAWVHGPVSLELLRRFDNDKSLQDLVTGTEVQERFAPEKLNPQAIEHIHKVLEVYGKISGTQLTEMSHQEDPWLVARKDYLPREKCEAEINETLVAEYYRDRLS